MSIRPKERIFKILDGVETQEDRLGSLIDRFMVVLISLNVVAVILETVRSLADQYGDWFQLFELVSVIVFTLEYLLRLWSCTSKPAYQSPFLGRLRFALTPLAIIDLLAILPFFLPLILPLDLRFTRVFRLFRLLRIFKLVRYNESLETMVGVLQKKKGEIGLALFGVFILLIFSSSLMYILEHEAQPESFSSIPAAMWWGAATLTTVGYGDIYPVTPLGRLLGAFIAMLGVGVFALPAGMLASGFSEAIQKKHEEYCPHCGKALEQKD